MSLLATCPVFGGHLTMYSQMLQTGHINAKKQLAAANKRLISAQEAGEKTTIAELTSVIADLEKSLGLSPRTVAYVHSILHRACGHALQWGLIASNPVISVNPPRPSHEEIVILTKDQVRDVLTKLRGGSLYLIAALGLATGLRRGELLALRWSDVDLDAARLRVEQSLEQTKAGLRFKAPKTKHGRRSVSLPASIVAELRNHRRQQAEQRLALGLGKDTADALVFRHPDGTPLLPHSVTTQWRRAASALGLSSVTLHAWRHTHASQLIASGDGRAHYQPASGSWLSGYHAQRLWTPVSRR